MQSRNTELILSDHSWYHLLLPEAFYSHIYDVMLLYNWVRVIYIAYVKQGCDLERSKH